MPTLLLKILLRANNLWHSNKIHFLDLEVDTAEYAARMFRNAQKDKKFIKIRRKQ